LISLPTEPEEGGYPKSDISNIFVEIPLATKLLALLTWHRAIHD